MPTFLDTIKYDPVKSSETFADKKKKRALLKHIVKIILIVLFYAIAVSLIIVNILTLVYENIDEGLWTLTMFMFAAIIASIVMFSLIIANHDSKHIIGVIIFSVTSALIMAHSSLIGKLSQNANHKNSMQILDFSELFIAILSFIIQVIWIYRRKKKMAIPITDELSSRAGDDEELTLAGVIIYAVGVGVYYAFVVTYSHRIIPNYDGRDDNNISFTERDKYTDTQENILHVHYWLSLVFIVIYMMGIMFIYFRLMAVVKSLISCFVISIVMFNLNSTAYEWDGGDKAEIYILLWVGFIIQVVSFCF